MAGSGFFDRLANLWRGFASLWISDVEKKHPEIAYENAIGSMVEKYTRLKSATAAIIRRRDDVTARLEKEQRELDEVTNDLNVAMETQQDDLALVLIEKKDSLEKEVASLNDEMAQAKADADDAKNALMSVKSEIKKLKAEKDRMLAKMQSAQARMKVQEQIDGLSVDAEVKALDNVRDHIKTTVAEASLGKEIHESDLDQRLAKLRQQGTSVSAKAKLESLKAARAQAAQATKKSM